MTCHVCKQGPPDGPSIFRVNEPGEMPSVWACREHLGATPVPPDVDEIVTLIESASAKGASDGD